MKSLMDEVIIVGSDKANLVMITLNGSHEVLGVKVAPDQEPAVLEQAIKQALTDANSKLQKEMVSQMQKNGGAMEFLKKLGT